MATSCNTTRTPARAQRWHLAKLLAIQVIYLTPVFWFVELLQNNLFHWAQSGRWGWTYPNAEYPAEKWFSFESAVPWAMVIALFFTLHHVGFQPRNTRWRWRIMITAGAGFMGEWLVGWVCAHVFKHELQHWTDARLTYIKLIALPFWVFDVGLYYFLISHLRTPWDDAADVSRRANRNVTADNVTADNVTGDNVTGDVATNS